MAITLRLRNPCTIPISVKGIVPRRLVDAGISNFEKLPIWFGNRQTALAEVFEIKSSTAREDELVWEGDLSNVSWIGHAMNGGSIHIDGDVRDHLGSQMSGGQISVDGSAREYVGAEMNGGVITIANHAGDWLGAAYPGSSVGVSGGKIVVGGHTGNGAGFRMRRGTLIVKGDCGQALGWEMRAGTIIAGGRLKTECGRRMIRGTIILNCPESAAENSKSLPATFSRGGIFQPVFLDLIKRHFDRVDLESGRYYQMFHGDHLCGGRGEVFIPCVNP